MKKIAIYTIQSYNYGNRLQNYATQVIIDRLGYKAYSLKTGKTKNKFIVAAQSVPMLKPIEDLYPILKKIAVFFLHIWKNDKKSNFDLFNCKLRYSNDYIGMDDYSENLEEHYNAIVAGSDQIWNTEFEWISLNAFLPFKHKKKIAFSASFGVDNIKDNEKIKACLNDFSALSVREESGAAIIKRITGAQAEVLIDPTMLLSAEDWRKVEKKPKGVKGGYILTYFLSPPDSNATKCLEEVKGDRRVYRLLDQEDPNVANAGPSEFLWLFDHADLVLTDSFHACVFSFLFNVPFLVYDRNWNEGNMNSRLDTLLGKFHLQRKYMNSGLKNDIWEHDYTEGYRQLNIERKKSIDFLTKSLGD